MPENNIEKNSNMEEVNKKSTVTKKPTNSTVKNKTTKSSNQKSSTKKSSTVATSSTPKKSSKTASSGKKTSTTKVSNTPKKGSDGIAEESPVEEKKKTTTRKTTPKTGTTKKNTVNSTAKKTTRTKNDSTKKIEKSKAVGKSKKSDDRIQQIISEQLKNVDKFEDTKPEIAKKKKVKIDEKQISQQIEKAQKMPKDEKKKIYKKVFANILLGIFVTLYFIGIGIGFFNIDGSTFITDLKVFSLLVLAIAIILFEYAYGKDDDKIVLYGIEMLCAAIVSLVLIYTCILHQEKFIIVTNLVACVSVIYYLVKSTSIYIREKLKWKKTISDVKEIISEG